MTNRHDFIATIARGSGIATILAAIPLAAGAAQDDRDVASEIEATRDALGRWVETRKVISEERRDWALGREILEDRIALLSRELETLQGRVKDAESSVTEADRKRDELVAQNDALKASSARLSEIAAGLEARTKALVARLPDPIRERIAPLFQRLPEDGAKTELALSTRFQNVVGILNEINKFNRDIVLASEVRRLPDGTTAEVTAMYLGIGQGYYVGGGGKLAGIGAVGPEGWTWTPANESAEAIGLAISIMKNESPAAFVPLPVKLD
ncbi:MAG: hypothetical protein RIS86_2254 [Planctomycetota bacterium]|jgi:FtsZ-binding cell division protein ZapB